MEENTWVGKKYIHVNSGGVFEIHGREKFGFKIEPLKIDPHARAFLNWTSLTPPPQENTNLSPSEPIGRVRVKLILDEIMLELERIPLSQTKIVFFYLE